MSISGVTIFCAQAPGPRVLIMGGIHGNEPCGVFAVQRLISELESGARRLRRGQLTLVVANLEALAKGQRSLEANLNRLFLDQPAQGISYEHRRAEELKALIRESDFLLDLHSTRSTTEPFLMAEEHLKEEALQFSAGHLVLGFASLGSQALCGDTESYGHKYGVKSFTMESGQQGTQESRHAAYQMALRFLAYTGIIEGSELSPQATRVHRLKAVFEKRDNSFQFARRFTNFSPLAKGDLIGYECGEQILAESESTLVILCDDAAKKKVGEELYFIATTD